LSLGAPALVAPLDSGTACGRPSGVPCDLEAAAVQNAVTAGMTVVVAAGNQGSVGSLQPTLNTMGTPADAPNAIAVAATTNSHSFANALTVAGLGTFHARYGNGPVPSSIFSAPLGDVQNVGDPLACSPLPAGSLAGLFALVQRGICTFAVKVVNLQAAGASGALITNNPGDDSLVTAGGLGSTTIPAVFVGYDDGQQIRSYLAGAPQTVASVGPNLVAFDTTATANQVALFSSRGPVLGSNALKPDVAAVGSDVYLAAQTYDPNGELYSPDGYVVGAGTSFSAPQVAGVAALVKQKLTAVFPGLTPLQLKSAIVNSATQDVTDSGAVASVLAVGAGKVSTGSAVSTNLVSQPATVSFGAIRTGVLPATQAIQLTNIGTTALSLSQAINRRTPETNAHLSLDTPSLTLAPGQSGSFHLLLSGTVPSAGIYEGFVTVQGGASTLQIPYLYVVGTGVPYNIIPLAGDGDDGIAGQTPAFGYVVMQLIDQYGVPVPNYPVTYSVLQGGGKLVNALPTTDNYGLSLAQTVLGPGAGPNVYGVSAGALSTSFTSTARLQPTILPNGVVSAANYSTQPPAPGSYVSIFGAALAETTLSYSTPYLPISLNQVSVSFDTSTLSVPGHIAFISPGQLNVQIPWELQGQSSVQVKVSIADASGAVYTLPLATYSPALFQYQSGGQNFAAALDENNQLVSPANPVAQGHVAQLFLNGLGPVSNQPLSGDPAPSSTLATTTAAPVVTIGPFNAQVQFSGLVPGNAGLYQINAVVPNTGSGVQDITVAIGGVTSAVTHVVVQ
jgi:minor extracellular serine protease Vpr